MILDCCPTCEKPRLFRTGRFGTEPTTPSKDSYCDVGCTGHEREAIQTEFMDLIGHIERHRAWSALTFGPRDHRPVDGILDHLKKELKEIAENPADLEEWIDLITLAIDGAWRFAESFTNRAGDGGLTSKAIADVLAWKLNKNMNRTWPDWKTAPKDKAIEHVRNEEPNP